MTFAQDPYKSKYKDYICLDSPTAATQTTRMAVL